MRTLTDVLAEITKIETRLNQIDPDKDGHDDNADIDKEISALNTKIKALGKELKEIIVAQQESTMNKALKAIKVEIFNGMEGEDEDKSIKKYKIVANQGKNAGVQVGSMVLIPAKGISEKVLGCVIEVYEVRCLVRFFLPSFMSLDHIQTNAAIYPQKIDSSKCRAWAKKQNDAKAQQTTPASKPTEENNQPQTDVTEYKGKINDIKGSNGDFTLVMTRKVDMKLEVGTAVHIKASGYKDRLILGSITEIYVGAVKVAFKVPVNIEMSSLGTLEATIKAKEKVSFAEMQAQRLKWQEEINAANEQRSKEKQALVDKYFANLLGFFTTAIKNYKGDISAKNAKGMAESIVEIMRNAYDGLTIQNIDSWQTDGGLHHAVSYVTNNLNEEYFWDKNPRANEGFIGKHSKFIEYIRTLKLPDYSEL